MPEAGGRWGIENECNWYLVSFRESRNAPELVRTDGCRSLLIYQTSFKGDDGGNDAEDDSDETDGNDDDDNNDGYHKPPNASPGCPVLPEKLPSMVTVLSAPSNTSRESQFCSVTKLMT